MKPYQAAERATSSQPATPPVELLHAVKATDAAQAAVTRHAPASQIAVRLGDRRIRTKAPSAAYRTAQPACSNTKAGSICIMPQQSSGLRHSDGVSVRLRETG